MPKRASKHDRTCKTDRAVHAAPDDIQQTLKVAGWDQGGRALPDCHPAVLLREEFMKPMGLSAAAIAKMIPPDPEWPHSDVAAEIDRFLIGDDDAVLGLHLSLALDRIFGLSPGFFWLVEARYDVRTTLTKKTVVQWLGKVKSKMTQSARRGR